MADKRLEMVFNNDLGRTSKITVDNVLDSLTEVEVQAAMQSIIAANIFDTSGGELVGIESARFVTTDIQNVIE